MSIWLNGQLAETISLADRGLAYGDGVFETMKVVDGKIPLLDWHWQRLLNSCQRLQIPLDIRLLQAELDSFLSTQADLDFTCKLIITRGLGQRGYAQPKPCLPNRILLASASPVWPSSYAEEGICLFECQTALARQPLLAGIKHLNRLEQVLARNEWQDSKYAEGLMRDTQGWVIEGVFSNIFCVINGCLVTPDLSDSGVEGVRRQQILDLAKMHALSYKVAKLSLSDLAQASEVFMCNSSYGIWPVREFSTQHWLVGPITRKLQRLIEYK
ncbi:aminodeoxychorismate lyase [Pseudomonas sp. F1_0610]|uniref:aminodeoxychorismate lyase n=1 Tax=Pseudomonas sp. F1_0610 TaxID=3114284 RepID=UPI0039C4BAE0